MQRTLICLLLALLLYVSESTAQTTQEPWTASQLLAPQALADSINSKRSSDMLILSVGPGALIKGSADIGPGRDTGNIAKLKAYLKDQKRDKEVVIYCGCCPFDHCPNIRPAFKVLKEMGFANPRLLNLSHNIKVDWLDHNYPVKKQ